MSVQTYKKYLDNMLKYVYGVRFGKNKALFNISDNLGVLTRTAVDLDELFYIDELLSYADDDFSLITGFGFLYEDVSVSTLDRIRNMVPASEVRESIIENLGGLVEDDFEIELSDLGEGDNSIMGGVQDLKQGLTQMTSVLVSQDPEDEFEEIEEDDIEDDDFPMDEDDDDEDFEEADEESDDEFPVDEDEEDEDFDEDDSEEDFEEDEDDFDMSEDDDDFEEEESNEDFEDEDDFDMSEDDDDDFEEDDEDDFEESDEDDFPMDEDDEDFDEEVDGESDNDFDMDEDDDDFDMSEDDDDFDMDEEDEDDEYVMTEDDDFDMDEDDEDDEYVMDEDDDDFPMDEDAEDDDFPMYEDEDDEFPMSEDEDDESLEDVDEEDSEFPLNADEGGGNQSIGGFSDDDWDAEEPPVIIKPPSKRDLEREAKRKEKDEKLKAEAEANLDEENENIFGDFPTFDEGGFNNGESELYSNRTANSVGSGSPNNANQKTLDDTLAETIVKASSFVEKLPSRILKTLKKMGDVDN